LALAAEWIHVISQFPPRASYGDSPSFLQTQTQIAVRRRFHFGM
jgi:hypothetical protein